ncbi:MAG: aminotransferase class I/II-fold pyridoxal phosphate-dependent enzyme [Cytophagaceae bacterium]
MIKKANKNTFIENVNEIISIAREKGIVHLYTEDEYLDGNIITIDGQKRINFGSCSYLGLELDKRLKDGAIKAVEQFGTQFSSSRTYVSCTLYKELENLIQQIFKFPAILSPNTSMGHLAVIPILVEEGDAVILDHQAHYSMQEVAFNLQVKGITVTKVRHNRLDELQTKINDLENSHNKIWYFVDGVYSMYGDLAPLPELIRLMEKNKKLHLYVDDAHGMSWVGENGSGSTLAQIPLHSKMILSTSLAKGFGSAGGIFIFPNEELYWKVKNWGGALTHSGPQQPAVLGASIASAKIHLSDEIYDLQADLADKILYCNKVLTDYNIPLIGDSISPIFFVGLGLQKTGYNMVHRLAKEGLHVNLGIYPAVPEQCTGIRFTITRHHTHEDIDKLGAAIAKHLPLALQEEERTMKDIYRAFRSVKKFDLNPVEMNQENNPSQFKLQHETTIKNIPQKLWNDLMADEGYFDWNGMNFLEKAFSGNKGAENNWDFHYLIIRDKFNTPVLSTFLTVALTKDDMLAPEHVSRQIEESRINDPYYLTSKTLMMGSLTSSGKHLYIDRTHSEWKQAMVYLMDTIWNLQEKLGIPNVLLRDFEEQDHEIRDLMMDQGFVKFNMPDNLVFYNENLKDKEDYIKWLSASKRYRLKQNVLKYEQYFKIENIKDPSEELIEKWYELYNNVREKNLEINSFKLPYKLFKEMAYSPDWECMQFTIIGEKKPAAITFNYKNANYSPVMGGMDYEYLENFKVYKQILFQSIVKGIEHGCPKVFMGYTASLEKLKLAVKVEPVVAYVQMKDNFNVSLLSMMPNTAKSTVR